MDTERRQLMATCAFGIVAAVLPATSFGKQERAAKQPNRVNFQKGDFLWPKTEGAFIPYAAPKGSDQSADVARWTRERDAYVVSLEADPSKTDLDKQRLSKLRRMTYLEFRAIYANAAVGNTSTPHGSGLFNHVGHVAILDIDDAGIPWVIEAIVGSGTIRHTYDEWLTERRDDLVWHGRVKDFSADDRSKIAIEASRHVGKPYKFFNFNLLDDTGFYCSKLAWMSTFRALDLAIDGKSSPKRLLWVSPKQLLGQNTIERLHSPGSYTSA